MLEVIKYITSGPWVFIAVLLLIAAIGELISDAIKAWRDRQ